MGVYEYQGDAGLGYLRLATAHGTVPITDLKCGDLVDFGENEPPKDGRWTAAPEGAAATRLPDNHPDLQPVVEWPEPEPDEATAEDAAPADQAAQTQAAQADSASADSAKPRSKSAKTTA